MEVIKLIVVGPIRSGKTTVANFLAEATEIPYEYRPTQGVRILEFEMQDMNVKNKHAKADVELWDCSGDQKFESCWPVIRKDANGVIFVLSDKNRDNTRELEKLYDYFVVQSKLGPRNCVLFYLDSDTNTKEVPRKLPSAFSRVSQVVCNLENDGNKLRMDFQAFVATLLTKIQEQTAQEENVIADSVMFRK